MSFKRKFQHNHQIAFEEVVNNEGHFHRLSQSQNTLNCGFEAGPGEEFILTQNVLHLPLAKVVMKLNTLLRLTKQANVVCIKTSQLKEILKWKDLST